MSVLTTIEMSLNCNECHQLRFLRNSRPIRIEGFYVAIMWLIVIHLPGGCFIITWE